MRRFIRAFPSKQYASLSTTSRLDQLRARLRDEHPGDGPMLSAQTPAPSTLAQPYTPTPPTPIYNLDGGKTDNPDILLDKFNRFHNYLRISLTEKCNLRCQYCMPAEGVELLPSTEMLTTDEIVFLAGFFVDNGVRKLRLTGGEPLVRKGVVDLVRSLSSLRSQKDGEALESLGITTNGLVLERMLPSLVDAGLTSVNISLDTLQEQRFQAITRRKGFGHVRSAIDAAVAMTTRTADPGRSTGLKSVKVNVVVMRGVNEDELGQFIQLTKDVPLDVRFIEWMPFDSNNWDDERFVSYSDMLGLLETQTCGDSPLERCAPDEERASSDTTKWYRIPGALGRVGFITSMSEHFCGTCNRLRVTADGRIKACLFGEHEVDLRAALRGDVEGRQGGLAAAIQSAVKQKHFSLGGHRDMYAISEGQNRSMIRIGG
mmetsp:Transcript_68980/g.129588  ORF Transcript_68980/g.129588 Transcript_68980/m.129588 type:complete len:430 (+) Transcript_68980:121-1410(+)